MLGLFAAPKPTVDPKITADQERDRYFKLLDLSSYVLRGKPEAETDPSDQKTEVDPSQDIAQATIHALNKCALDIQESNQEILKIKGSLNEGSSERSHQESNLKQLRHHIINLQNVFEETNRQRVEKIKEFDIKLLGGINLKKNNTKGNDLFTWCMHVLYEENEKNYDFGNFRRVALLANMGEDFKNRLMTLKITNFSDFQMDLTERLISDKLEISKDICSSGGNPKIMDGFYGILELIDKAVQLRLQFESSLEEYRTLSAALYEDKVDVAERNSRVDSANMRIDIASRATNVLKCVQEKLLQDALRDTQAGKQLSDLMRFLQKETEYKLKKMESRKTFMEDGLDDDEIALLEKGIQDDDEEGGIPPSGGVLLQAFVQSKKNKLADDAQLLHLTTGLSALFSVLAPSTSLFNA